MPRLVGEGGEEDIALPLHFLPSLDFFCVERRCVCVRAHKCAYPNISLENRDFVTGIARKKTQTVSSPNPPYFLIR